MWRRNVGPPKGRGYTEIDRHIGVAKRNISQTDGQINKNRKEEEKWQITARRPSSEVPVRTVCVCVLESRGRRVLETGGSGRSTTAAPGRTCHHSQDRRSMCRLKLCHHGISDLATPTRDARAMSPSIGCHPCTKRLISITAPQHRRNFRWHHDQPTPPPRQPPTLSCGLACPANSQHRNHRRQTSSPVITANCITNPPQQNRLGPRDFADSDTSGNALKPGTAREPDR